MCASTSPSEESQLDFYIYSKEAIKTHSKPYSPNWEDKIIYLKNRWSHHFKTVLNKPKIKYWDVAIEKYRSKYKNLCTNERKRPRIKQTEEIYTFEEVRRSQSSSISPNVQQTNVLDYSPNSNKNFEYCKQSSCSCAKSAEQKNKYNPYDVENCPSTRKNHCACLRNKDTENSNDTMKNYRISKKYWNAFDSSYSAPSGCCSRSTTDFSERSFRYKPNKNIRHSQKSRQGQNTSEQVSCCNSGKCSCVHFKTCNAQKSRQYSRNTAGGKPSNTSQYSNDSDESQYKAESVRSQQYDNHKKGSSKLSYESPIARYANDSIFSDSHRKTDLPSFISKSLDNNRRSEQSRHPSGSTRHTSGTVDNIHKSGQTRFTTDTLDNNRYSTSARNKSGTSKVSQYSTNSYSTSSSNDGSVKESKTRKFANYKPHVSRHSSKDSRYTSISDDDNRKSTQLKMSATERGRSYSTLDSCSSNESCDSECTKSFITFEQVCSCLDKLNRKCGERIPKCKCKNNPARKRISREKYDFDYIQDQLRKERNSRNCSRPSNVKKCYSPVDTCVKYTYSGSDTSNASSESCPSECERSFVTCQKVCPCVDRCDVPKKSKKCSSPRKPQCTISTQSSFERTAAYLKPNCRTEVEFIPVNNSCMSQESNDCNDFYSTPSNSLEFNIRCAKALSVCNKNSSTIRKPSSIACSEPLKPTCVPSKPKCSRQDESRINCISSSLKCTRVEAKPSLHSCTSSEQSLRSCASSASRCETQNQVQFKPSRAKCNEGISNHPSCKSSRSSYCERMNKPPSCEPSIECCCDRGRKEPSCMSSRCACRCTRMNKPEHCGRRKCPLNQDCVCISMNYDSKTDRKCSPRPSCKPKKRSRPKTCDYSPSTGSVCRHCIETTYQKKNCTCSDNDSSTNISCGREKCPYLRNMKPNKNSYRNSTYNENEELDYVEDNNEPRDFFRPDQEDNNRKKKSKSILTTAKERCQEEMGNLLTCTDSTCKSLKEEIINIKKNLKCVTSRTKCPQPTEEDQECIVKCCSSCTCCEEETKQNLQCCCTTPGKLVSCTERTSVKAHEILKKFRDLINPSKNEPRTPLCLHSSKSVPELNEGVCLCTSSKLGGISLCPNLISELSEEKVSSDLLSNFTFLDRCCSKPNCPYWQDTEPDSCTPATSETNCNCNEQNAKLNFSVYTHVQDSLLNNTISFPRSEEMCDKKSCPMKKEPIFIINSTSEPPSSTKISKIKKLKCRCKNKGEPLATFSNCEPCEPVGKTKIQRNEKDTLTDKDKEKCSCTIELRRSDKDALTDKNKEECSCTRALYKGELIVYRSSFHKSEPKLKINKLRKLFRCANTANRANSVPLCQKSRTPSCCNAKSVHFSRKNLVHCIPANEDSKPICYVVSAGNESEKVRRISNSSKSFNLLSHCKDLIFPQKNATAEAIAPRRRWLKDMIEAIPSKMYRDIPDVEFKFVAPFCSKKCHVIKMKNLFNI